MSLSLCVCVGRGGRVGFRVKGLRGASGIGGGFACRDQGSGFRV